MEKTIDERKEVTPEKIFKTYLSRENQVEGGWYVTEVKQRRTGTGVGRTAARVLDEQRQGYTSTVIADDTIGYAASV